MDCQRSPKVLKTEDSLLLGKNKLRIKTNFCLCRLYIYLYLLLSLFSCYVMSDSLATPCTVAHQAPLSMGFSFSRGSSQPRDWTCIPCTTGRFFTTELPGNPELYCRPRQKTQVSVILSLNMACILFICHDLPCTVPVRCLIFHS